jgi:hypothetical protein
VNDVAAAESDKMNINQNIIQKTEEHNTDFKVQNMSGFHFILKSKLFQMENNGGNYTQPPHSWYRRSMHDNLLTT